MYSYTLLHGWFEGSDERWTASNLCSPHKGELVEHFSAVGSMMLSGVVHRILIIQRMSLQRLPSISLKWCYAEEGTRVLAGHENNFVRQWSYDPKHPTC
uniref:Uncharacterized protein n=1 Tax=Physcomitrium patens TaxID=3218 RepID=A0A2K1ISI8_PHYPA|nr:hypothetical protein PHYPA_026372 [Physcomitrium patens]